MTLTYLCFLKQILKRNHCIDSIISKFSFRTLEASLSCLVPHKKFPSSFLPGRLAFLIFLFIILTQETPLLAQQYLKSVPESGFEKRITDYIDTIRIIDNHEHLADPQIVKQLDLLDFMLLLHQYNYNDLISSGLPKSNFDKLFNQKLPPKEKWDIIAPYWEASFNTANNRLAVLAARTLFGVDDINRSTVDTLSARIARAYQADWTGHVLNDLCRIDYLIQDGDDKILGVDNIKYVKRFTSWLTVRSKYRIDSIAIEQVNPILTLEDFVLSLEEEFNSAMNRGVVAVKVNMAYYRTLKIDNVKVEEARRVFRSLRNGDEDHVLTYSEAKPLQDYMFHRLMDLAQKNSMPVVFHTGLHSGNGNYIANSDPSLLSNIFMRYPEIKFSLFHGSYPYGGELSALAKNFPNVFIDLNWIYAISPSYSERYLHEWLETIPVNKIMAFGGDFRCVENIYGELLIAKQVISKVLISKVGQGYFSEQEALKIAKMILYDNSKLFYKIL